MSRNLEDLHPDIIPLAVRLSFAAAAQGINLVVTQTRRTLEEQAELYAQGRTKPGKIVTNAKPGESAHNYGLAFDVAFREGEHGVTWVGPWGALGEIAAEIGLEWGGNWRSFPDRPHFELPGWRVLVKKAKRRNLDFGDTGPDVEELWQRLSPPNPDGDFFGTELEERVKGFQRDHGLKVDGIVGPKTWAALERAAAAEGRGK